MSQFCIEVDEQSFHLTSGRTVVGEIEMVIDGQSFPDEGWSDFVVVVLAWWIEGLSSILEGRLREVELLFMDGPFGMSLSKVSGKELDFDCWKEPLSGKGTVICGRVEEAHLASCLLQTATKVVTACKIRGWAFDDLNELTDVVAALEGLLSTRPSGL